MITPAVLLSIFAVVSYGEDILCPARGTKYFPHPTELGKTVGCTNGIPAIYNCPDGLLFNEEGGFCYDPKHVLKDFKKDLSKQNCHPNCPTIPYPYPRPCPSCPPNTGGGCSGYLGYGRPVGTCSPCNDMCKVHFLADESDCTVYYICNWGRPVWNRCPEGLYYNRELNQCDFPQKAGCRYTNQCY